MTSLSGIRWRHPPRAWTLFSLIAVLYAAGAELSFHDFNSGEAFGFPPAGITLAAMLLVRKRLWPAIMAAIVVSEIGVDLWHGITVPAALAYAAANVTEPIVGASCVIRWSGSRPDLRKRRDLLRFIVGAVTLGPLAGGLIGATADTLMSGGWWPGSWLQWWAGDGIAVMVIGAPVLLWARHRVEPSKWLELGCLVAVTAAVSVAAFRLGQPTALLFLPLLGWAAFRLADLGVVLAGTAFACVANYMTAAGYGEFAHMGLSSPATLVITQAYIAVAVLLAWLLAQEISGRAREVRRGQSERRRREAADARRMAAELGFALADAATVYEVGRRVSATVQHSVGADHVVINVLSADKTRFEQLAGQGFEAQAAVMDDTWAIGADAPGPQAVRDRQAVYVPDRDPAGPGFADATHLAQRLGLRAVAALPLLTEVGTLGYLGVWWKEPHVTSAAERAFLHAMAETTSRALERAWLREAQQRERTRIAALAELTRRLAAALTAHAIGEVVIEHVCPAVGNPDAVWLGIVTADRKRLERIIANGAMEQPGHAQRYIPVNALMPAAEAFRTRRPVIIGSPQEYVSRYPAPDLPAASQAWSPPASSWLTWPLRNGSSTVGALSLAWISPHSFGQGQLDFVAAVADLLAQALVRARLYDDEHAIATVLQRAIRPAMSTGVLGLDVGSCYRQAGVTGTVGGDWYDAVALARRGTFLSIGDVVGHGIAAARDMTQLRNAARAFAVAGFQPAPLLRELGRVADAMTVGQFATAVVAIADQDGATLTYASAGHPPPLVRRAGSGSVELLAGAAGPALGPFDDAVYTQGRTSLAHGDIVLMYTDGLVERPGEDLREGISRVVAELRAWHPWTPLDESCDKLVAALAGVPPIDDICVLAVRRSSGRVYGVGSG